MNTKPTTTGIEYIRFVMKILIHYYLCMKAFVCLQIVSFSFLPQSILICFKFILIADLRGSLKPSQKQVDPCVYRNLDNISRPFIIYVNLSFSVQ